MSIVNCQLLCHFSYDGLRVDIGHFLDKPSEINAGVVIGPIRNDSDDGEGQLEIKADLCYGGTFHLHALHIGEQTDELLTFLVAVDELVAAGNVAYFQFGIDETEFLLGFCTHNFSEIALYQLLYAADGQF